MDRVSTCLEHLLFIQSTFRKDFSFFLKPSHILFTSPFYVSLFACFAFFFFLFFKI